MALDLSALNPQQQVAAIYIGYFDRAPDPIGSQFWESAISDPAFSLEGMASDFATQPETLGLYPFFEAPNEDEAFAFISLVYLNLFNRVPDQAGLDFWGEALIGSITGENDLSVGDIILSIIQGAQDGTEGNDRSTVLNKIAAATAWTDAAEAADIDYTNDTDAQASAKLSIGAVTDAEETVDAAKASIDSFFGTSLTLSGADQIDEGAANTFTASLASAATQDVVVTFQLVAGDVTAADQGSTVTNLNDFAIGAFNPVSVTIPAGSMSATFDVTSVADDLTELPEGYAVTATAGYTTVGKIVTVLDATPVEEVKTYTLTASAPSVTEGDAGTKNLTFTLTLDEAPNEATTINYQTLTLGTATAGDDFNVAAGTVTFAAGQNVGTVTITVNADTSFEADETVAVQFSGDALTASVTATGTITNDDVDPATVDGTYTLTTSVDAGPSFVGTSANDTYIGIQDGVNDTYTTGDNLDGGAGTDRLMLTITDNAAAPLVDMASIENVFIRTTAVETIEASGWSGVEQIWNDRSTADLAVTGLQELATVGVNDGGGAEYDVSFDVDLSGTDDAVTVATTNADLAVLGLEGSANGEDFEIFTFVNTGESAIAALQDVTNSTALAPSEITASGSGTLDLTGTIYLGLTTVTSADVAIEIEVNNDGETAGTDTTITSTGADDVVVVTAAAGEGTVAGDAAVTTVDLGDGDNDVTLNGDGGLQEASITTGSGDDSIDAEMDNGEIEGSTLTINSGAGDDTIRSQLENDTVETIDSGEGDDFVNLTSNDDLSSAASVSDSVDGGLGFDVLGLRSGDAGDVVGNTDVQSVFAGFEALRITNTLANDLDLTSFGADVAELQLDGAVAGIVTVEGFETGGTVEYRNAADMGGTLAVGMSDAADANTPDDTLNVQLNSDLASGNNFDVNLSVDGINILNVDAIDRSATVADATGDDDTSETDQADGYTLNLSNEENVDAINISGDRAVSYTASTEATELNSVDGSAAEGDLNIDLARFSGTEGIELTAGAGDDVLVGTQLSDVIVGGDGDDSITGDAPVTVTVPGVAQETQLTIGSNVDVGDTFSVTINGTTYTGTATAPTAANAASQLAAAIGTANGDIASVGLSGGVLTLVGLADGTSFDVEDVSSTNFQGTTETDVIEFSGQTYETGDQLSYSVSGGVWTVSGSVVQTDVKSLQQALVDAINGSPVEATASLSLNGDVILTGDGAGFQVGVNSLNLTNGSNIQEEYELVYAAVTGGSIGVTVNGSGFSVPFNTGNDTTVADLAAAINGAAGLNVTASVATGTLTLTGPADGSSFSVSGPFASTGTVTDNGVTVDGVTADDGDTAPSVDNDVFGNAFAPGTDDQTISNDGVQQQPTQEETVGGQTSDELTGGAGSDTFNFASGDSTEAAMDVITDFEAGAANADFDTLNLTSTSIAADVILANQIDVAANSVDATAATDIGAIIEDGIITLVGADAAEIDTLAEWIDVAEQVLAPAEVAAFEFDGSTYVVEEGANIIELEGTVGIVGVSTTEDTNVLHIA